ncbi:two-component regulator propeller domain-containing protein [Pontibacter toksunensis]|uniref:Two-component regulator propeller domain-containing protein n=1 Tax=Pontibacter toksunensis TaxID=1332631 RepID=A0ABW6BW18_9BACT
MYCIRFFVTLSICLLLIARVTLAQQYNFRNWTLEQGLPQSQITALVQDHQGFLWVATRGGLSRFDGINFRTYTKKDGLASHNITRLYKDSRKQVWIGTSDAGMVVYNGTRFKRIAAAQGLPANQINDISEDSLGQLWVATDKGIYYRSGNQFQKYSLLPENTYTSVRHIKDGAVWAGTRENGLYEVHNGQLRHYTSENSKLPGNYITALSTVRDNTMWIGTDKGLARVAEDSLTVPSIPANLSAPTVTSFTHDKQGNLWIGLLRDGLLKYKDKAFVHVTRRNGLRTPRITALTTDTEGTLWIGTNGYGLQQYKSPWFVHYFDFESMSEPRVTAITPDSNGGMWLGTDEGEMASMQKLRPDWHSELPWPKGTTIYSICPKSNGETWVCSSNGVWLIKPGATQHYTTTHGLPSAEVFQTASDASGDMWFATASGLAHFRNNTFVPVPNPGGVETKANCIFRDSKSRIWVGTQDGIYNLKAGKLLSPPELKGATLTEVGSIAEDNKGNLYFSGFNQGILMLHEKGTKLFTASEGLPNEAVKSLFVDKQDNLWVATSRDVLKLSLPQLRDKGRLTYRSYASQNGFRGLEVCENAMAQSTDGTIWFGTTKGLTQYLPALDQRNTIYPKAMLTEVMLFSKPTDWKALGYTTDSTTGLPKNLLLPHTQNYLSFDFHAICMSGPEQVRYKYRLLGFDEQWSPAAEQSFTTYANLSPGDYTFELLARNNDGVWAAAPVTFAFSIVPPIWRREWFIGVLLLVFAVTVLSVVRLRERSLVQMNSLLEMRVHHRTRLLERKNREKEMLLQEIHHRVKNNLQIVISMLNLQARHLQDPRAVDVMQAIRSRVRSMSILHERLYQHSDLDRIDLEEYFEEICESLYAAYGVSTKRIALTIDMPQIKVNIDSAITLGLIVNELVSNTLKYAFPDGRHGQLRIELAKHDEVQFTLKVIDNGRGLPEGFDPLLSPSFGLKLVTSLSRKLEGNIKFLNKNGTQSILYFVLAP